MNKELFKFELKYWLLSKSTLLILALWTVILGYSTWNGTAKVRLQQTHIAGKLQEEQKRHQDLVARMDSFANGSLKASMYWDDVRNAFDLGSYLGTKTLVKPPLPLAAVNLGQMHLFPSYNLVSTNQGYWFMALRKSETMDNPVNVIFGHVDLAFSLIWLFPLIIIALNFNILSIEKEQGTLPMLLSHGVTVGQIARSKSLFRFVSLTLCTALLFFILLLGFGNEVGADLLSTGTMIVLIVIYSAIWHVLAVAVNYMGKSSNFNMGWLFAFWLGLVIVLPVLLNVSLSTFYRVPGKMELISEVREKLTEYDQKNSLILDQYYTDHPQFVSSDSANMMPLFMYKLAIRERSTAEAMYPQIWAYYKQMQKQTRIISSMSIISPGMLMQESLEELSGHSTRQFIEFSMVADKVNRQWREYFFPLSMGSKFLTVQQFNGLPKPTYQTQVHGLKLLWLTAGLLIWLGLALWWSRRMERKFILST